MDKGYITPSIVEIKSSKVFSGIEDDLFLEGTGCINSNNMEESYVLLDFGMKTTGYFFIELKESSSDYIVLEYGPLRNTLYFKKELKMPDDGKLWVDDSYIALRYLKLSLRSCSAIPDTCYATIKRLGIKFSAYPCVYKGSFNCEDEVLNSIWKTGAYTTQLCIQKAIHASVYQDRLTQRQKSFLESWKSNYSKYLIFDGPRRDREAWIGDVRTEALTVYSAFGAYDVAKSSIEVFYDLQSAEGIVPGCAATWQDFKEYNFWWIVCIWENYLFSGDREFLTYIYPGFKSLLDWIFYNTDDRGFIYNDKTWMWTFPREGYGSATQCVLFHTLECAAQIELEMGNYKGAESCRQLSAKLKGNILKEYWDEDKGVFYDILNLSEGSKVFLSDVNCYAVVFGIADHERSGRILKYLKENMWTEYGSTTIDKKIVHAELDTGCKHYESFLPGVKLTDEVVLDFMWPHNKQIWPFMNAFEVEANFLLGNTDEALKLIKRCWGNMLLKEPGTFWELVDAENGEFPLKSLYKFKKDDVLNSACHGWSGWVSYLMQAYILGIKPAKPGFKEVDFFPCPGDLHYLSGTVPTPQGVITVRIENNSGFVKLHITHPVEIVITFDIDEWKKKNSYGGVEFTMEAEKII